MNRVRAGTGRGLTLIELLIVIALLSICGGGVATATVRMMREHAAMQRKMARMSEARLVMEALARDLARASAVKVPSEANSGDDTRTLLSMELGREPCADPGGRETALPKRVGYVVALGRLERRVEASAPMPPQTLCRQVGALEMERRGDLLHVEVECLSDPKYKESATRLTTDFYVGGRLK